MKPPLAVRIRARMLRLSPLLLLACQEPPATGDALVYLGRANTPTFYEPTDVVADVGVALVCTGVRGLTAIDVSNPRDLVVTRELDINQQQFDRCTHVDWNGSWAVAVAPLDDITEVPVIALIDMTVPERPEVVHRLSLPGRSPEEVTIVGSDVSVAGHDEGLLRLEVRGRELVEVDGIPNLGNVGRVARRAAGGVWLSNADGQVFSAVGTTAAPFAEVGPGVQALLELEDGRLVVAVGSAGLVLLDSDGTELQRVDTNGTALRLDTLGSGQLVVANWSDMRVYDIDDDGLSLYAVDAVFQAGQTPRHLAGAAFGPFVYAGEWEGVHALELLPGTEGPELSVSRRTLSIPDDGAPHSVTLTVSNEGRRLLVVEDVNPPRGWSTSERTFTLEPGGATLLTLSHPGDTDPQLDTLEIASNDPDERPALVTMRVGSDRVFVGDPAPEFDYRSINPIDPGVRMSLADQRGRLVLINYFGFF